jgi:hypothetical protein
MVKNRRGWIKILEAFIGIMLLFGIVLFLNVRKNAQDNYISDLQKNILDKVSLQDDLRDAVLKEDKGKIEDFIRKELPNSLEFKIKICSLNDLCYESISGKNVFVREKVIISNLKIYSPKKVRFFAWATP